RAYRVDHGKYPTSLAMLQNEHQLEHGKFPTSQALLHPSYLRKFPADPFAVGQALSYKLTKTGYKLYSVGPDGVDNGGTPVSTSNGYSGIRQESTGDILAGVNRG